MGNLSIFLARHAKTNFNAQGRVQGHSRKAVLTDEGALEARWLGERLKKLAPSPERIYASGLIRSIQTAEEQSRIYKMEIICDSRLNEMFMGKLEGRHYHSQEFRRYEKLLAVSPMEAARRYGTENFNEVLSRMMEFFLMLSMKEKGDVIVNGHGEASGIYLAGMQGLAAPEYYGRKDEFLQKNCTISKIEWNGSDFRLAAVFLPDGVV